MKKQKLVVYKHDANKLFYVGVYDFSKNIENSCSLNTNYSRAKYLLNSLDSGDSPRGLKSGFMISLINTDFSGWDHTILDDVYENALDAARAKDDFIFLFEEKNPDYTFIGSERTFVKGSRSLVPGVDMKGWTAKWNLNAMTMHKVKSKIEFIIQSLNISVPESLYKDAYMCIMVKDHMTRRHNFTSFEINDLVSLFKYVRNYLGYTKWRQ